MAGFADDTPAALLWVMQPMIQWQKARVYPVMGI